MSDEITIDDLKKVIARIKPEAVKLNGVHGTLCKLEKFFVEADIQRIKCYIRDEKKILAWDALLDVLKCSDGEAFEEYVNHILSNSPTFPRSFQQALIDACCECRIGWLCKDLAASGKGLLLFFAFFVNIHVYYRGGKLGPYHDPYVFLIYTQTISK